MRALIKVIRTESGLEQFTGFLTDNHGKEFFQATRWSEAAAINALVEYLGTNDGEAGVMSPAARLKRSGNPLSRLYSKAPLAAGTTIYGTTEDEQA